MEIDMLRERLHDLSGVIMEMQKLIAVQNASEGNIAEILGGVRGDIKVINAQIAEIHSMANRWKGGFVVLAGLGGLLGWLVASWQNLIVGLKRIFS